jgi:1,4-alpha-glucan branching enzyme
MVADACKMWLGDYRADGLRFDSANDLPREAVHHLTWCSHAGGREWE